VSDNLAEQLTFESEPEEHDQEKVYQIKVDDKWVSIVPGTLLLGVAAEGLISFEAALANCENKTDGDMITGMLAEITGLRSISE